MKCEICNRECKNFISLSSHVSYIHKLSSKEYYDKYLKQEDEERCSECKKETKFVSISKGYRKFCSSKCSNSSQSTLNKIKNTNIIKYNVEHVSQRSDIKNQKKIKSQIKFETNCPFQNEKIKNKIKETNKIKLGVYYPTQNNSVKEKIRETNIKKYGVDNPFKSTEVKKIILDKKNKKILSKILKFLNYINLELCSDYTGEFSDIKIRCKKCDNFFINKWNNIQQGSGCPFCNKSKYSKSEKEIFEFIKSIESSEIIENSRNIIKPYELDIYIPSKSIAIEFDGLYYHSELFNKDKNYHLNKTELCEKQNIQLIHIFEDEWLFKQDVVKSKLKQILQLNNNLPKIYARKCEIREIYSKIKNEFLNKFHLQGEDKSSIKLGAFYNGELISVMTFSKGSIAKGSKNIENIWELSRFCSNYNNHIIGIAGKLLSYFKNNYEWKKIFSYADRRWSLGNVYRQIGFEIEHTTKPNYFYYKNSFNRIHRFNLRKRPDEPKDIPEWILRSKEGYHRIYDCGHYKFKMINNLT